MALSSGCNSPKKCDFTCCSDVSCDDGNAETKDFCAFPSTIDSVCANKVENPDTLRIEEFAVNHILNEIKVTEPYYITKVYFEGDAWYVHVLLGDDKATLVFSDDGTLLFTEAYTWV